MRMKKFLLLAGLCVAMASPAFAQTNSMPRPYKFSKELKAYDEKIAGLIEQMKALRAKRSNKPQVVRSQLLELTRQVGEARRVRRAREIELIQEERERNGAPHQEKKERTTNPGVPK